MRRTKRFTVRRVILAFAVAAIIAPTAQAKPAPVIDVQSAEISSIELGPGEIPYVSHAKLKLGPGEVPYVDDGTTSAPVEKATAATAGDDTDLGFGLVSAGIIGVLLAAGGAFMAVRQTRRTRFSPA